MVRMKVEIDQGVIECDIQYGNRKKLSIHMDAIGLITVKAPKNLSEEIIINAIKQNGQWIRGRLDEISKLQETSQKRAYEDHGKFLYLGKEYSLHELIKTRDLEEEELKKNLKKFYITSCTKIIGERIKIYQQRLGVKPKAVEIVESDSQWGSCNSSKKITFNYRLAMAPMDVIDYVIVHELCHLIHMNHDRSFWRRVGSIVPDYKKKQEYLARFGHYMTL
ncbi:M48 family metallopeptidase [Anaerosolibacter sp.]|uniref:M48 family metallopeptidase n=1 Tax=Anaerosolibacter sp. TaxID=1872527 RepID=UPI0039F10E62